MLDDWFGGAQLICSENPLYAVSPDYPSVHVGREKASKELGRPAYRGEIRRRGEGAYSPDPRVFPSNVIAKEDKVWVAHNWPNALYLLNSVLVNPPA